MPATFKKSTNRFRIGGGTLTPEQVRARVDKLTLKTSKQMAAVGKRLADGKINIPQFQIEMRELIKNSHSIAASIGRGGRKQMKAGDWGKLGNSLNGIYKYFNQMARDIEKGKIKGPRIAERASKYSMGIRKAYYDSVKRAEKEARRFECRRLINSKEGCKECAAVAAKGWISVDEMPNIGDLYCTVFCLCEIEYR